MVLGFRAPSQPLVPVTLTHDATLAPFLKFLGTKETAVTLYPMKE